MEKIRFLVLILIMSTEAKTQNILGRWYAINENHLAEFVLNTDSVKMQMVESEADLKGYERGKIKHVGIFKVNHKNIVIVQDNKSLTGLQYRAMTFFDIKDRISIELAANGIVTASKTVEGIIDLIAKDTTKLFGNVFYHEDYLPTLKSLKNLEVMSIDEFKNFLRIFINKKNVYAYREQYMPGTFQDQLINSTLIEIGFNPIARRDWFDRFLEKYLEDEEVETLWRKMLSN